MKTNFSKIIALVLSVMMLMSTVAFASMDTDDITASYVEFSKDAAGNITARAMLHNDGDLAETAKIIIAAYDGTNVAFAGESEAIPVAANGKAAVSATIAFDEDCTYKAFLWTAGNRTPLAEVANAEAAAELKGIEVNGVAIEGFSTSKTTYDCALSYRDANFPVVKGITADNAVYATTAYSIADDKKSATAVISVYNIYGSENVQKTYTVNFTLEQPTLTADDYDIVDKTGLTLSNSSPVARDAQDNLIYSQKTSAAAASSFESAYTNGVLYTNLSGPQDYSDPELIGSAWVTDYLATANRMLVASVDPAIEGCEYFAFKHPNNITIDNSKTDPILTFKVTKPCVVKVLTNARSTAYTGFEEEYSPYIVNAWQGYTGFLTTVIPGADANDKYNDAADVPFEMAWDIVAENPNMLTWDEYYDKYFKDTATSSKADLLTYFQSKNYYGTVANEVGYWKPSHYTYKKVYDAGDVVSIPRATVKAQLPSQVVVQPLSLNEDKRVIDIGDKYYKDATSSPVAYDPSGKHIEYVWVANGVPSNITYDSSFTNGLPYANLSTLEDYDDPNLRGSYWGYASASPSTNNRFLIYDVNPAIEGAEYFTAGGATSTSAAGSTSSDSVLEFNALRPCKVWILATSGSSSFEGFTTETGTSYAKTVYCPSYAYGTEILVNASADDKYEGDADIPFGMIWDRHTSNPNRMTWDQYYDKWFANAGGTATKDQIQEALAAKNVFFAGDTIPSGSSNVNLTNGLHDYNYAYTKTFPAGRVVIPKDTKGVNRTPTYIIAVTPAETVFSQDVVDLDGVAVNEDTTSLYGYAQDGTTILRNGVSSSAVATEYAELLDPRLHTNLSGILDYDDKTLIGTRWVNDLTPSGNRRFIFHVDPRFQGAQYFVSKSTDSNVVAAEGANTLKFKVDVPCTVSIIAQNSGLSFEGFTYEYVNDAIMAWQSWWGGPGVNQNNYGQICKIDENDPYATPATDVAFGMIWDMTPYNPARLNWDQYYAKWFEGKTETSSAALKTSIETQFAFQNNADGVADFNAGLKTDSAGYFRNGYDFVYTKKFPAGEVVIPREANGKALSHPIIVITPYDSDSDKTAANINEKLWYDQMSAR